MKFQISYQHPFHYNEKHIHIVEANSENEALEKLKEHTDLKYFNDIKPFILNVYHIGDNL